MSHPKIEANKVSVTYTDSNHDGVLNDEDTVTVNGHDESASSFAMRGNGYLKLLIGKANDQGVDTTDFAREHSKKPQKSQEPTR